MTAACDLIIVNGTVVDGSGAPGFIADVAISDDRIVAIGSNLPLQAARRIDVAGRVVAPGFIDVHTHDDRALLSHGDMTCKVSQGVTTVVAGNCGVSLAPLLIQGQPAAPLDLLGYEPRWFRFGRFAQYRDALADTPPAVNCGLLVGHITLRHGVMDHLDRPATSDEAQRMADRVEEALTEGAIGFSTGLDYPSSVASSFDEVLTLVRRVKPLGGIWCCHHRNYFEGLEGALEEVFELGGRSEVPVVISHHQCTGQGNFGKGTRTRHSRGQLKSARRE
jgi:N-acyl-D-amino-acid deacylase